MQHEPEVVVVTGASGGVGRAIARVFGEERARVALLARGEKGLEGARREIEQMGGEALVLPTDVADPEQVEAAAEATERAFGPIDTWVNAAMVTVFSPVAKMTAEEYRRVTEVNYLGYVHGTLAALRRMAPRDSGRIVQVGSALAYRAIPLQSAYCASKFAVRGFTEALRCELLHDGSRVRVTEVNLPAVNTPQFTWARSKMPRKAQPVPPIFQPELIAHAVRHAAAHPERKSYTLTASALQAMVGQKVAPALVDRYLAKVGYEQQMLDEAEDPSRRDNLYHPIDEDRGAHGPFDARAKERALVWQVNRHPVASAALGVLGGLALGGALTAALRRVA